LKFFPLFPLSPSRPTIPKPSLFPFFFPCRTMVSRSSFPGGHSSYPLSLKNDSPCSLPFLPLHEDEKVELPFRSFVRQFLFPRISMAPISTHLFPFPSSSDGRASFLLPQGQIALSARCTKPPKFPSLLLLTGNGRGRLFPLLFLLFQDSPSSLSASPLMGKRQLTISLPAFLPFLPDYAEEHKNPLFFLSFAQGWEESSFFRDVPLRKRTPTNLLSLLFLPPPLLLPRRDRVFFLPSPSAERGGKSFSPTPAVPGDGRRLYALFFPPPFFSLPLGHRLEQPVVVPLFLFFLPHFKRKRDPFFLSPALA